MKRSKMVEILEKETNKGNYQDYQIYSEEASAILKTLEDNGMSPPYNPGDGEYDNNNTSSKNKRGWEKE
jgi:hypothetical protein